MSTLTGLFGGGGSGGGSSLIKRKVFDLANVAALKTVDLTDIPTALSLTGLASNGTTFLRLLSGVLATSTDLSTWTNRAISDSANIEGYPPDSTAPGPQSVAYSNGYFWCGATNSFNDGDSNYYYVSLLYRSSDGITWTRVAVSNSSVSDTPTDYLYLSSFGSSYLMRTYGGYYQTSTNGTSWTNRVSSTAFYPPATINGVMYFPSSTANNAGKFTTDGTTITTVNVNIFIVWYDNGYYYGIDNRANSSILNKLYRGTSLSTLAFIRTITAEMIITSYGSYGANPTPLDFPLNNRGYIVFNEKVLFNVVPSPAYGSIIGATYFIGVLNKEGFFVIFRSNPVLYALCNSYGVYYTGLSYGSKLVFSYYHSTYILDTEFTTELVIP